MQAFWEVKTLEQLDPAEWEALCDGCGKCCLHKVIDEESGDIQFTNVACRLLDAKTCRCTNYPRRKRLVNDCQVLTPKKIRALKWLPQTCAYRLVAEGRPLPRWHHLLSGNSQTIHNSGASVKGRIVSEDHIKNLEDFVVDWIF